MAKTETKEKETIEVNNGAATLPAVQESGRRSDFPDRNLDPEAFN